MPTAVITGITGQDGSYLAEFLLEKGYEVHGIIRRSSTFNTSRIDHIYEDEHSGDGNFHLHYGDLSDGSNLNRVLEKVNPTFDERLKKTYEASIASGKWKNCYAAENHAEYWAEAVQSWFGTNRENDAIHNHVNTRDELKAYDPEVAKLCAEVFGDNNWQYRRADDPARKSEPHLKNLDREKLPVFEWSDAEKKQP